MVEPTISVFSFLIQLSRVIQDLLVQLDAKAPWYSMERVVGLPSVIVLLLKCIQ